MSVANRRKLRINQIHRTPRITLRSVDKGVRGWRCNSLDPKRPWRFSLLAGLMVISFGNFVAENRQNPLSSIKRDPGKLFRLCYTISFHDYGTWSPFESWCPTKCTVYYIETNSILLTERETRNFRFLSRKKIPKISMLFDDDIIIVIRLQ